MPTTVASRVTQEVQVTVTIPGDFRFAQKGSWDNGQFTFLRSGFNNVVANFWLLSEIGRKMISQLLSITLATSVRIGQDTIAITYSFDGSMRHKDPDFFVQSATHNVGIFVKMAGAQASEDSD